MWEKTHKKLNSYYRRTTTTMRRKKKKRAIRLKVKI
jgi:hypothetical protein